jgi:hypothetical protein
MEIGSIVECINDNWSYHDARIKMPVKGKLYTVIGFCDYPKGRGIYIEECAGLIGVCRLGSNVPYKFDLTPFLQSRLVEMLPPMDIEVESNIAQELELI